MRSHYITTNFFKTEPCVAFALWGRCPYDSRCSFLHVRRLPVFVYLTCKK